MSADAARTVAWRALERAVFSAVPTVRCTAVLGEFMAMGRHWSSPDDRALWAYKHVDTRRYVFIDDAGTAYVYDAGLRRYDPVSVVHGIARARGAV